MAKVGIKDLAAALASKKKMDAADAEKYIESFFALVNEALVPDKIVKIKGFGTFKLVDVRDRESVDVNTGERMVIDGHSKMSFVPDATLKELVNKPFSQFETVVLNDGVDFDNEMPADNKDAANDADIDSDLRDVSKQSTDINDNNVCSALSDAVSVLKEQDSEPESIADKDSGEDKHEDNQQVPHVEPSTDSIETKSSGTNVADDAEEESVDGPDIADVAATDDEKPDLSERNDVDLIASVDDSNSQDDEATSVNDTDKDGENVTEKYGEEDNNIKEEHIKEEVPPSSDSNVDVNRKKSRALNAMYVFFAVAFVSAAFFSGYYFGENKSLTSATEQPKKFVVKKVVKRSAPTKKPVSAIQKPDSVSISKQQTELKAKQETEQKTDVAENMGKEEKNISSQKIPVELNNAKRMVETGAYVIEGLDKSVVVKRGQNVKTIARQFLGDGMECYIQLFNRKIEFKEGETVNIPKLRLKKKTTNKKVS